MTPVTVGFVFIVSYLFIVFIYCIYDLTTQVAFVVAPLVPRISTGVGNMGFEIRWGSKGGGLIAFPVSSFPPPSPARLKMFQSEINVLQSIKVFD